jgi:hypothetical protein
MGAGRAVRKSRSIPELSVVALRHPVQCEGGVLPQGVKGTVVHIYRDGEHYEVEFAKPFPCTITLRRDDIPSRMSQLPRVANAILDDRKITQYLLVPFIRAGHPRQIHHVLRFLAGELG